MSKFYKLTSPRQVPAKQRTEGETTITRNEPAVSGRHYIGDGAPGVGGGFEIAANGSALDFAITAGRILVDGLEVLLDESVTYATQPASQFGLDIEKLPDLPPAEGENELVRLDV